MEIHPYVQGRLRTLPRQDESSGILLGNTDGGVTRVTGFKRVSPGALRQAASDAGSDLVGFYRLQTTKEPALQPEEEELWRQFQPEGQSLFLLVKAVNGGVEATAWTREKGELPVMEAISLDSEFTDRRRSDPPPPTPTLLPPRSSRLVLAQRLLLYAMLGLVTVMAVALLWPVKPEPGLALELQSGAGELTAIWAQQGEPKEPLEFARLSILDGAKEETIDLTRNYTSHGRITVRPQSRDVVCTLSVQYAGRPLLSRGAMYAGFVPRDATTPAPVPSADPAPTAAPEPSDAQELAAAHAEIEALRKRNKELEEAVAALRKHFLK